MKKFLILVSLALLTSCAITNPAPGPGVFYTDVKELIYYNPKVVANVESRVCSNNYLGIVSTGDSGLYAMRTKAKIGQIASIEKTYNNIFLIYAKSCMIVRGKKY